MLQTLARETSNALPPPRYLAIGCGYLVAYVGLDWLSFVEPLGPFGITPWNPTTGASFALILAFGRRFIPWLFIAPLLADGVLRQFPLPLDAEIAVVAMLGGIYAIATWFLTRHGSRASNAPQSAQDLIRLLGTAAVAAMAARNHPREKVVIFDVPLVVGSIPSGSFTNRFDCLIRQQSWNLHLNDLVTVKSFGTECEMPCLA